MTIFETVLSFANELLTFYIPTFFTFKFLMNNNHLKTRAILKFWCILTLYHLLRWFLCRIIAQNIFPLIDLIVLVALNWKEYQYSDIAFDTVVGPAYTNNRHTLEKISGDIQKVFDKKTKNLKDHVTDSTSEKLKSFIGQILVGTLNPSLKRKDSSQREQLNQDSDKDE